MKQVYLFCPEKHSELRVSGFASTLIRYLSPHYDLHRVSGPPELPVELSNEVVPIYVLAHHESHGFILPYVFSHPGIAVFYDYSISQAWWSAFRNLSELETWKELSEIFCSGDRGLRYASLLLQNRLPADLEQSIEFTRKVLESSVCCIAHNPDTANILTFALHQRPVHYVPLGYEDLTISSVLQKKDLGIPEDSLVLASFGSFSGNGLHLLPDLIADLRLKGCPAFLLLVGRDQNNEPLEIQAQKLGIQNYLRIYRNPPETKYRSLLNVMDIGFSLRFPPSGDFSRSVAEMMGAGRPVIQVRHRFNSFLNTGIFVRPTHLQQDLLSQTLRLWKNPDLRFEIGKSSALYIRRNHPISRMVEGYKGVIKAFSFYRREFLKT